jgi:putative molybdopterin biosynthesis protein
VYELRNRGLLNAYRVGRKLRFTADDVQLYIASTKDMPAGAARTSPQGSDLGQRGGLDGEEASKKGHARRFCVAGQDVVLDILGNYLFMMGIDVVREHRVAYDGLVALYRDEAEVAAVNLWDGESGVYNVPYVRRFLPGVPSVVVRLVSRMQGLYVAAGNPRGIREWEDLLQPGLRLINRERGSGPRVLLDEHLRMMGGDPAALEGYAHEVPSPVAIASMIVRGRADVSVGDGRAVRRIEGIDFIPLQEEHYDLALKRENFDTLQVQALMRYLESGVLREEIDALGGYDTTGMGRIVWFG